MCQHFLLYKSYTGLQDESGLAEGLIPFLAHSPLPATAELCQGLKPRLLLGDQNVNVSMHAESSCLNSWSNSTLGGCDRYPPDGPSKQTPDAVPEVHTCSDLQTCVCHVCACAPFTRAFYHTTGEGAPWALGCFGREVNFSPVAELLKCCKVNGSKVPSSRV